MSNLLNSVRSQRHPSYLPPFCPGPGSLWGKLVDSVVPTTYALPELSTAIPLEASDPLPPPSTLSG